MLRRSYCLHQLDLKHRPMGFVGVDYDASIESVGMSCLSALYRSRNIVASLVLNTFVQATCLMLNTRKLILKSCQYSVG